MGLQPRTSLTQCLLDKVEARVEGVRCDVVRVTHVARRFAPHFFERYAFTVIDGGVCRIRTARGAWTAGPGSLMALAPEEVNEVEVVSPEPLAYRTVYLPAELVRELVPPGTARRALMGPTAVSGSLAPSARLDATLAAVVDDPDDTSASGALLASIVTLLREGTWERQALSRPRRSEIVGAAREFLRAHVERPVCLEDVARALGVSTFHLIKKFRQVTGVSPYAYLILLRMNRARAMLDAGLSIADAVHTCRFSDQSHLTRTFRRTFGVPPGRYSRAVTARAS